MDNMRIPESYLRDVLPNNPESVLDVGVGLSGIFASRFGSSKRALFQFVFPEIFGTH